jgi:HPt (histidine-containing phosphotransfer) domain-containing protein
MVKDIAQQFIHDITGTISRMGEAITAGDCPQIAADAHTVKGSVASFGLYRVEKIARQLEASAKAAQTAGLPALHESLRTAFTAGCEALNAFLADK